MKIKALPLILVVGLILVCVSIASAGCRIMLLGDSITYGVGEVEFGDDAPMVGYRQFLWKKLKAAGYVADFVGSQKSGYAVEGFDYNHEGHSGWTAGMIADNVYRWLIDNPPDVVVLHIGTNDITKYSDTETIVDNIDRILDLIDNYESVYNREVTVILAQIINRKEYSSLTASLNLGIGQLAADRQAGGDRIILVDMENALVYPDDMYDLLHPNSLGYRKMANAWAEVLEGFLPCPGNSYSIWNPEGKVGYDPGGDSQVELGVRFRSDSDGFIEGIRFYKYPQNTGPHTGSLWTDDGKLLGSVTFTRETAFGWQQANFAKPIPIRANKTYIASYHTTAGHYAVSLNYFSSDGFDNAPLHALRSEVDGLNGVYEYGPQGSFPNKTYSDINYSVDVAFALNKTPSPGITTNPVMKGQVGVKYRYDVNAVFDPAPVYKLLNAPSGMVINKRTGVIKWIPEKKGSFDVKVRAVNEAGMGDTQRFSIDVAPANTTYTIWGLEKVPCIEASGNSPVELGVKFRSDADGYIKGIRFYKYPLNTGIHTGNLWTRGGTLLGSVTFTEETAAGWQQANFATPIPIRANRTYIASYHTTTGHFAKSYKFFSFAGVDKPPLHALRSGIDGPNGLRKYGPAGSFPKKQESSSNYWVDVVFAYENLLDPK